MTEILKKITKAKAQIGAFKKTADNPFHKSKYVPLSDMLDAVIPALTANGLELSFSEEFLADGVIKVSASLYEVESDKRIFADKILYIKSKDPQASGSLSTYGMRYSLALLLALPMHDDDGEGAMGREPEAKKEETPSLETFIKQKASEYGIMEAAIYDALKIDPNVTRTREELKTLANAVLAFCKEYGGVK